MKKTNINSSVFIEDYSSSNWKACSFFWKNIYVYESYIQNLCGVEEKYLEIPELLLRKGILKIVMKPGDNLRDNLYNKVYAGMNNNFYELLYKKADDLSINANPSENWKTLAEEVAKMEYQDNDLCELMDSIHYKSIEEGVFKDSMKDERVKSISKKRPKLVNESVKKIVGVLNSNYKNRDPKIRYGFEQLNESLLIKNEISSSILTSKYQLPYYYYKFNNSFRNHDANYYIEAINSAMPFIEKDSIDNLTFEEILKIRKNRKWENAMLQLGEICKNIKYDADLDEYKREINNEIIAQYNDSLEGYTVTRKNILTNTLSIGISFISVLDPITSILNNISIPAGIYKLIKKREDQKNLVFFLNDISKGKY